MGSLKNYELHGGMNHRIFGSNNRNEVQRVAENIGKNGTERLVERS